MQFPSWFGLILCGIIPAGSHAEGSWSSFSEAPQLEDRCKHVGMGNGIDPPCVAGWFIKDCMSHGQLRLSCFSVPNLWPCCAFVVLESIVDHSKNCKGFRLSSWYSYWEYAHFGMIGYCATIQPLLVDQQGCKLWISPQCWSLPKAVYTFQRPISISKTYGWPSTALARLARSTNRLPTGWLITQKWI